MSKSDLETLQQFPWKKEKLDTSLILVAPFLTRRMTFMEIRRRLSNKSSSIIIRKFRRNHFLSKLSDWSLGHSTIQRMFMEKIAQCLPREKRFLKALQLFQTSSLLSLSMTRPSNLVALRKAFIQPLVASHLTSPTLLGNWNARSSSKEKRRRDPDLKWRIIKSLFLASL